MAAASLSQSRSLPLSRSLHAIVDVDVDSWLSSIGMGQFYVFTTNLLSIQVSYMVYHASSNTRTHTSRGAPA